MARERLPARRRTDVMDVLHTLMNGRPQLVTVSFGYYDDGRIGEVFIDLPKVSNDASNLAHDVAVLISIALQHGAGIEELRRAVGRDERGGGQSVAGSVLDVLAEEARQPAVALVRSP